MRREADAEGRRWLAQAKEDLRWAERLADDGAYYLVCFLAQQIAEKALKAFLYAQGEDPVLGHSVRQLGMRAAAYDPAWEPLTVRLGSLDTFYIVARYPNGLPADIPANVLDEATARRALELARTAVTATSTRLSGGPSERTAG